VRRLTAERELLDRVAASWAEIDLADGAAIAGFFAPDGVFDMGPARYAGREAIAEAFRARAARGPRVARHVVTNQRIELEEDDRARVTGYLVLYAGDGEAPLPLTPPTTVGEVTDRFVRDPDEGWLLERRTYRPAFLAAENPSPFAGEGPAG
jgi:uncharacterized protein (TIGR02246 family)